MSAFGGKADMQHPSLILEMPPHHKLVGSVDQRPGGPEKATNMPISN